MVTLVTCHHNTDHPSDSLDTPHTVRMGYIMLLQTQTVVCLFLAKRQIMDLQRGNKEIIANTKVESQAVNILFKVNIF